MKPKFQQSSGRSFLIDLKPIQFQLTSGLYCRYDHCGTPQAFGAEAYAIDATEAEKKGWQLAKHFKLHLHPPIMKVPGRISLDTLPRGVKVEKIYADFFRYLYTYTQDFFKEHGTKLWKSLVQRKKIEFVIAHPNGWTPYEQAFLRNAVVEGGLIPRSDASLSVHMIAEAEASVHFVMFHENIADRLQVYPLY